MSAVCSAPIPPVVKLQGLALLAVMLLFSVPSSGR